MNTTRLHTFEATSESARPHQSVLLIHTPHLHWVGLRTILLDYADASVVGDVQQPEAARQIAQTARPTLIITPDRFAGLPIFPLLHDLHTVSPASRIIVIGEEKTLDHDTLSGLRPLPVVAYVVWEDLPTHALALCLDMALRTNILLASPAVVKLAVSRTSAAELTVRSILTEREQEVFRLAGTSVRYDEIAAKLCISKSTVKTHAAHIRHKLELSAQEDLGAAYRRLT